MADYQISSDGGVTARARWLTVAQTELGLSGVPARVLWLNVARDENGLASDGLAPFVRAWKQSTLDWGAIDRRGMNMWSLPSTDLVAGAAAAAPIFYKMRGMDASVDGLYDSWLVEGSPDTAGTHYAGALNTPLRDIVVVDSWSEGAMPAAHGAAHQAGGSQQINVANLRGVLADPQRAGSLVVPGPATLAVGAVADGQFLRRVANDIVGKGMSTSIFDAPYPAHAYDQEFDSVVLPPTWQLWDITTNPAIGPVTPTGLVNWLATPPNGQVWMQANHPGRPSWLSMQAGADNKIWFYGFQMTLTAGAQETFRCRVSTVVNARAAYAAKSGICSFAVIGDNSGKPGAMPLGYGPYIVGGWWSDAADATRLRLESKDYLGTVPTPIISGADFDGMFPTDFEVVFSRVYSGSRWWAGFRSPSSTFHLLWEPYGMDSNRVMWAGVIFSGAADGRPFAPVLGVDYVRFATDFSKFLP